MEVTDHAGAALFCLGQSIMDGLGMVTLWRQQQHAA